MLKSFRLLNVESLCPIDQDRYRIPSPGSRCRWTNVDRSGVLSLLVYPSGLKGHGHSRFDHFLWREPDGVPHASILSHEGSCNRSPVVNTRGTASRISGMRQLNLPFLLRPKETLVKRYAINLVPTPVSQAGMRPRNSFDV